MGLPPSKSTILDAEVMVSSHANGNHDGWSTDNIYDIAASLSNGGTTISKTVGGRFGGLEIDDVENAGGDAHFDDNTTICPNKDEFDYVYAYYYNNNIDFNIDDRRDRGSHHEDYANAERHRRTSELSPISGETEGQSQSDSRAKRKKEQISSERSHWCLSTYHHPNSLSIK